MFFAGWVTQTMKADGVWAKRKTTGKRVQLAAQAPPVLGSVLAGNLALMSNSTHILLEDRLGYDTYRIWRVDRACLDTLPDRGAVTWDDIGVVAQ